MKIAVIGSGISGLVAAHRLNKRHDVTVFEADDRAGGHTRTAEVQVGGGTHAVDMGFIVYNERTYPGLVNLFEELGVESQPTRMSFGVRCERTGIEWGSRSLRGEARGSPAYRCGRRTRIGSGGWGRSSTGFSASSCNATSTAFSSCGS